MLLFGFWFLFGLLLLFFFLLSFLHARVFQTLPLVAGFLEGCIVHQSITDAFRSVQWHLVTSPCMLDLHVYSIFFSFPPLH